MYEIFFISYGEIKSEDNWKKLKDKFPLARRIKDIKGIRNAHIAAANASWSSMFYVVDGDAEIVDDFLFDYIVPEEDFETVHVWSSVNPVNNLTYGYGGVKLLPKQLVINMDHSTPDMTTAISKNFKIFDQISNITHFNTDPFNAWKSAFRECVKLSSKVIDRHYEDETDYRLKIWCTVGEGKKLGNFVLEGANAGKKYGEENAGDLIALSKINDFDWLKEQYGKDRTIKSLLDKIRNENTFHIIPELIDIQKILSENES